VYKHAKADVEGAAESEDVGSTGEALPPPR